MESVEGIQSLYNEEDLVYIKLIYMNVLCEKCI